MLPGDLYWQPRIVGTFCYSLAGTAARSGRGSNMVFAVSARSLTELPLEIANEVTRIIETTENHDLLHREEGILQQTSRVTHAGLLEKLLRRDTHLALEQMRQMG